MKFDNNYQKQVWIHLLENVGTYNLYALLGKFDAEENIIIHNVNQGVDIYLGRLQGPVPLGIKRSLQGFELRGRNRNIIIQTFEKRSIIVIESVIKGSEKKRKEYEESDNEIEEAITSTTKTYQSHNKHTHKQKVTKSHNNSNIVL